MELLSSHSVQYFHRFSQWMLRTLQAEVSRSYICQGLQYARKGDPHHKFVEVIARSQGARQRDYDQEPMGDCLCQIWP